MHWWEGTVEDALRLVAERAAAAVEKRAAADDAVERATAARQSLGILGASPDAVGSAAADYRGGVVGRGSAVRRIRRTVPGAFTQAGNVPASVMAAAEQGRGDEVLKQLDVLGVKNVTPFSGNFGVIPAALSTLSAGGAGALVKAINTGGLINDVIGGPAGGTDHLAALPVANAPAATAQPQADETVRRKELNAARPGRRNAAKPPDLKGRVAAMREYLFGPQELQVPGVAIPARGKKVAPPPPAKQSPGARYTRDDLRTAARNYAAAGGKARIGTALGTTLVGTAALAPLLYREWLSGRGYRSGRWQAEQLLDAQRDLPSQR